MKCKWLLALQKSYDRFIYARAYHSIHRICKANPGFAYLMELYIKLWLVQYPISEEVKRATEVLFKAMTSEHDREQKD